MTTRNLVPRANNEGKLGISSKKWAEVNATNGTFSTLKVSGSLKVDAVADLDLFTSGAGIESITTNSNNQFVIAIDDTFLTNLGFNANGTKPDFAANGTVLAGDSFVTAINKLDQAVSNVADPADLDVSNFSATAILSGSETFVDNDANLMTAAAVNDRILSFGYTTNTGDITRINITAGDGLTGTVDTESGDHTQTLALASTNVSAGEYGDENNYPTFTVDAQGRLTAAGNQPISTSFTLSADSGNDDPFSTGETLHISGSTGKISTSIDSNIFTIDLVDTGVTAQTFGSANSYPIIVVDAQGRITSGSNQSISTQFTLSADSGDDNTFNTGETLHISGSTGKISTSIDDNIFTIDLANTTVTPGTYGDANSISQVTVDQQGRLTGASSIDIEIPKGQVTNFDEEVQDLVGAQLVTNGSHTGLTAAYDDAGDGAIDLTVNGLTLTEFADATIQTEAEVSAGGGAAGFGDNDTSLLTAAAIKQYIDSQGFGIGSGDITQVNITAGNGLNGSVNTEAGAHTQTLSLTNTGVTNVEDGESFGSATQVPTFTVDQQGRLTAAANANIAIPSTAITDFSEAVQDISGGQLVTNGTHAGISAAYDDANDGAIDLTVLADTEHIQDDAITADKLNNDVISGQAELAADLAATDELLVSDAGTVKRMDTSVLQTYMQNNLTFVDVSKANLSTRLASYTSEDTLNIGDAGNDTLVVIRGDLTVRGTTTTVDSTTIAVSSSFTFEGPIDDHETTLTIVDPTADHTIYLPNQGGYIPVLEVASTTQITSTPEEINLLDEAAANTIKNGKAVIYSNAGNVNATSFTGPLTGDVTGNATTASALAAAVNIGGVAFDGSASIDLPGVNTAGNQNTSGNADSATVATNITATANNDTDETVYLTFVDGATGTQGIETDTGLTYNPNSGLLTSTTFAGALTGNASTATSLANPRTIEMSGDVVWISEEFDGSGNVTGTATIQNSSVGTIKIADDAVDADKLAANAVVNASIQDGVIRADKLDIDGSTDINADLVDADLIIVDDGADGTNRKSVLSRVKKYIYSAMDGNATASDAGVLTIKNSAITNTMLEGSIENGKLENSTVSFGGVELSLGESDATPAFDLQDATNYPASSLTGTITNTQLAGSISNDKLNQITFNDKVHISSLKTDDAAFVINSVALADSIIVDQGSDGTQRTATLTRVRDLFQSNGIITSLPSLATVGTITSGTWNGTVITNDKVASDLTINEGTINNSPIGETSHSTGKFTTLQATTSLQLASGATITGINDTDNMNDASATTIATSESIKAYVDAQITAQDLDFTTSTGAGAVDLDSETLAFTVEANKLIITHTDQTVKFNVGSDIVQLTETQTLTNKTLTSPKVTDLNIVDTTITFEGDNEDDHELVIQITEPTADRTITIPDATDTLVGKATTDTLTNKTIDADDGTNSITNLQTSNLKDGVLDTSLTSTANTDTTIPSAKAVKTYVDGKIGRFGGIFKTDSVDANGIYDVIFSSDPIVRSHFGPFTFNLKQLITENGSDIEFFGATAFGASDRHFEVMPTTDPDDDTYGSGETIKGHCLFTGADATTP